MKKRRSSAYKPATAQDTLNRLRLSWARKDRRRVVLALIVGASAVISSLAIWRAISARRTAAAHHDGPVAPVYKAEVLASYPHDLKAFTQGLTWHNGRLFESTGLYGNSSLREVDVTTGKVLRRHNLADGDFGEGLTAISANEISWLVQVLWKNHRGYVYDAETFAHEATFPLDGDAWGIASVSPGGNQMYMTNGSSTIKVLRLDGRALLKEREFKVYDGNREVGLLNDLQVINGEIWVNVWPCELIARVNPKTGHVSSWVDLRYGMKQSEVPTGHRIDVLNGIAHDPKSGTIYVTGKLWPRLMAIQPTKQKTATNIAYATKAFFLEPEHVRYTLKHVLV